MPSMFCVDPLVSLCRHLTCFVETGRCVPTEAGPDTTANEQQQTRQPEQQARQRQTQSRQTESRRTLNEMEPMTSQRINIQVNTNQNFRLAPNRFDNHDDSNSQRFMGTQRDRVDSSQRFQQDHTSQQFSGGRSSVFVTSAQGQGHGHVHQGSSTHQSSVNPLLEPRFKEPYSCGKKAELRNYGNAVQNNFCCDKTCDTDEWATIPVKVSH